MWSGIIKASWKHTVLENKSMAETRTKQKTLQSKVVSEFMWSQDSFGGVTLSVFCLNHSLIERLRA